MLRIGGRCQIIFRRNNGKEKREVGTERNKSDGFFAKTGRSIAKIVMPKNAQSLW